MYTIASRSLCFKICSTQNHTLRYSLLRRKHPFNNSSRLSNFSSKRDPDTAQTASNDNHDAQHDARRITKSESKEKEGNEQSSEVTSVEKSTADAERNMSHDRWHSQEEDYSESSRQSLPFNMDFDGTPRQSLSDILERWKMEEPHTEPDGSDREAVLGSNSTQQKARQKPKSPSTCPAWFLEKSVILAEQGTSCLAAGPIKMIKGNGGEMQVLEGHKGLRSLLEQYQILYEEEEPTEESLDDKVGPFAATPSTKMHHEADGPVPHAFLSLSHYLEIALSIAAGLTSLRKDQPLDNSSKRTFLALYSPIDGSTDFLNQVVQQISTSQHADVIHLSALDLSDLSADIPAWSTVPILNALPTLDYTAYKAIPEHERGIKERDDDDDDNEEQMMTIQMPSVAFRVGSRKDNRGVGYFMPHERGRMDKPSVEELSIILDAAVAKRAASQKQAANRDGHQPPQGPSRLVLCISDFAEISSSAFGPMLLQAFERIVQRRRTELGQEIVIVGTSSSSEITNKGIVDVQEDLDIGSQSTFYRALIVSPFQDGRIIDAEGDLPTEIATEAEDSISKDANIDQGDQATTSNIENDTTSEDLEADTMELENSTIWERADASKTLTINSRHIKAMIAHMYPQPVVAQLEVPLQLEEDVIEHNELDSRILYMTEVHRIAILTAGMQRIKSEPGPILPNDIKLAMSLINSNYLESITPSMEYAEDTIESLVLAPPKAAHDLESIKSKCNRWEKRLLHCVISPDHLDTTFSRVHTKPDTIDALRTLTSMTLLRPDSFSYGVLQSESIPGVLLYGPPGTGKTLLAKAVAKESGAIMLAVSSSEVNHKYVGESEKTVRAIFSLARKLSPCVVFIDEADSLFQSRGAYHPRAGSHETMNQFLSEIEHFGGSSSSEGQDNVFLMIATNRPFDLDDAILRRVPRKLLVDLPTEADRVEILKIHLRGETLNSDVSISDLAQRTPFYSGSDLKNLCVAAALACVRDENAAAKSAQENGDKHYKYPLKRTLTQQHFETAVGEISASVSDDMGSLNQIRKFDEKYGDRKGRRERSILGFGQRKITDDMLRVRV